MAERPAPEILLGHAAFLKNLARALLRDEQAAEDVVQDAFLAAIDRPPAPGNLRAWLASVVRHLSLSRLRSSKRRARRERAAPPDGDPPAPPDVVSRMELQRRVVAEVLALDEPYRSAIAHRFLDEMSLKEIARETGVPVATARTRVRRGLERLRARLDAGFGDRRAWSLGLLALLAVNPPATLARVVARGLAVLAVAGGIVGGIVGGIAVLDDEPAARRPTPSPALPAEPEDAPAAPPPTGHGPGGPGDRPDAPPEPAQPRGGRVRPGDANFVLVPAGTVEPGATRADYERRATTNELKRALIYDVWGAPDKVSLPAFFVGRYEVTNAQWKHYLDRNFRTRHTCDGTETLVDLAGRYVKFRGQGVPTEFKAIYAMNWRKLVDAWSKPRPPKEEGGPPQPPLWPAGRSPADPPLDARVKSHHVGFFPLPKGLELTVYRHRIPKTWYGWCELSGLRIGKEYFDPDRPPAEAFRVPDDVRPLRARDFAAYPVRSVSPDEMLAFAEWAGCHLPSEYEFERVGRMGRPRSDQHTVPGEWNHGAQSDRYAFAGNRFVLQGPARVDDPAFAGGDTKTGVRHLLGNVYELTRTFYELHPRVVPKPPLPEPDLTSYALTAKGGCFGDPWRLIQLSTRTPRIGNTSFDLKFQNRVDTLGLRLVRHATPGWDLMAHSLLRLTYDRGKTMWIENPIRFAMKRAGGIDALHLARAESPYVHVREKATGVAFVPVWMAGPERGLDGTRSGVLGALRCDLPIRAGVRMTDAEYAGLRRAREEYAAAAGRGDTPLPPEPPAPDRYETKLGRWRERTVPPGEWLVVLWEGHLGLVGKGMTMPPEAILPVDKSGIVRTRRPADMAARVEPEPENGRVSIRFAVEEQLPGRERQVPPGVAQSELWALCRTLERGWVGRRESDRAWVVRFELPIAGDGLAEHDWNASPR